jgi:hypothetical protein
LSLLPEWLDLTAEEQGNTLAEIQGLSIEASRDMAGLKRLIARQFDIDSLIAETKAKVVKESKARRAATYPPAQPVPGGGMREKMRRTIEVPARIESMADLDALIRTLSQLRQELSTTDLEFILKGQ